MTIQSSSTRLTQLIDESIHLELNVSELYFIFFEQFPNDAEFWWQLVEEEKNHAALLRSGLEYFEPVRKFPERILHTNLDDLISVNNKLHILTTTYQRETPSRERAFTCAYTIEYSAGEIHFQQFMENETAMSHLEKVFGKLNKDDIAHAERIKAYMESHAIAMIDNFTL